MSWRENSYPLNQSGTNLQSGTYPINGSRHFLCVVAGDFKITWDDDTTSIVACAVGNAYEIKQGKDAEITSGTFHVV